VVAVVGAARKRYLHLLLLLLLLSRLPFASSFISTSLGLGTGRTRFFSARPCASSVPQPPPVPPARPATPPPPRHHPAATPPPPRRHPAAPTQNAEASLLEISHALQHRQLRRVRPAPATRWSPCPGQRGGTGVAPTPFDPRSRCASEGSALPGEKDTDALFRTRSPEHQWRTLHRFFVAAAARGILIRGAEESQRLGSSIMEAERVSGSATCLIK
jgi:hypothetical protein